MSENNLKNKNSLLVTSSLKVWDAESQKEKRKKKERKMDTADTTACRLSGFKFT